MLTRRLQEVHPDILEAMVDFLSSGASAGAPGVSTRTYYWGDLSKPPNEWESLRTREEGRLISGGARPLWCLSSLGIDLNLLTQARPGSGPGTNTVCSLADGRTRRTRADPAAPAGKRVSPCPTTCSLRRPSSRTRTASSNSARASAYSRWSRRGCGALKDEERDGSWRRTSTRRCWMYSRPTSN